MRYLMICCAIWRSTAYSAQRRAYSGLRAARRARATPAEVPMGETTAASGLSTVCLTVVITHPFQVQAPIVVPPSNGVGGKLLPPQFIKNDKARQSPNEAIASGLR